MALRNQTILDKRTVERELITWTSITVLSKSMKTFPAIEGEIGDSKHRNVEISIYNSTILIDPDDILISGFISSGYEFEVKSERLTHAI